MNPNEVLRCEHAERQIRYIEGLNQTGSHRAYYVQCLNCGRELRLATEAYLDPTTKLDDILPFDYALQKDYQDRIHKRHGVFVQSKNDEWWDRYNTYLKSPEWKDKRWKVLDRDNHTCQACLERHATQVHHLTYKHVFNEPLFELVSVCSTCHDKITKLDRNEE